MLDYYHQVPIQYYFYAINHVVFAGVGLSEYIHPPHITPNIRMSFGFIYWKRNKNTIILFKHN